MKKSICLFIVTLFNFIIFAAGKNLTENESIKAYRNAVIAFDDMDYGTALKYSEDAILLRKQQIDKELVKIKNSLTSKSVQSAGDNITSVLKILEDRNEKESLNIINNYIKKKGLDYFNNSISNLMEYMESSKVFPEAQKIIGDIYKLEGEYKFAEEYYSLALKNADVLDIPDEKYEILYMLADISRLENDFEKMEIRLLNILTDDIYFKDNALLKAMNNTICSNKKGSMEKLFLLYRANSFISIDAYNQLAQYYYENDKKDRALEFAALSAVTTFSKFIDVISARNSEFEYENLANFFQEATFYDDLVEWGSKNQAWKSFNILAKYATDLGYKTFARELLVVLVQFSPETYWQRDAVLQLEYFD